jgi:hypothetical protein
MAMVDVNDSSPTNTNAEPPALQGYPEDQLDAIDASVFGGDCYASDEGRARIAWYIARWSRELLLSDGPSAKLDTAVAALVRIANAKPFQEAAMIYDARHTLKSLGVEWEGK